MPALDGGPTGSFAAVAKSDSTTIGGCRALFVGTAGDLTVDSPTQSNIVFKNVANGTILPIAALRVKVATTAADIVALY